MNSKKIAIAFLLAPALIFAVSGCRREAVPVAAESDQQPEPPGTVELSLGADVEGTVLPAKVAPPPLPAVSVEQPAVSVEQLAVSVEQPVGVDELLAELDRLEAAGEFSEAWQLARDYRAEHARQNGLALVDERINRLNRFRREAPNLNFALRQLEDSNAMVRDVAARQLMHGGEAARILLLNILRTADAQLAVRAAQILPQTGGMDSFPDIFARFRRETAADIQSQLLQVCITLLKAQPPAELAAVADFLSGTDSATFIPLAVALYMSLDDAEDADVELSSAADAYIKQFAASKDLPTLLAASHAAQLSGNPELKALFLRPGLLYAYYEGTVAEIVAMEQHKPKRTGVIDGFKLDILERTANVAAVYRGVLEIVEPGQYSFFTVSDDGSFLFIGDRKVVDNGGMHGMQERSGTIALDAGLHPLKVTWYQGGGDYGLEVYWSGPGFGKQPIPAERMFHRLAE